MPSTLTDRAILTVSPCSLTSQSHVFLFSSHLKKINMVHKEDAIPEGDEILSTTESIISDNNIYNEMSLDNLFKELANQTPESASQDKDEFSKLKNRVENLPKIEAKLELAPQQTKDITRINDPIVVKQKVKEVDDSGKDWFNMKSPELTDSIKRDMMIIKQRSALDPKRHYKKEKWDIPKHFHLGTIIEGPTEFYSSRLSKKQRGTSLVDEILHDNDSKKYFKRKYSEIQLQKTSGGKSHYKKVQKMRRKY